MPRMNIGTWWDRFYFVRNKKVITGKPISDIKPGEYFRYSRPGGEDVVLCLANNAAAKVILLRRWAGAAFQMTDAFGYSDPWFIFHDSLNKVEDGKK